MKKLNKLVLNKAKIMSVPQMKNITGGGYFGWCKCSDPSTKWDCSGGNYDCLRDCEAGCRSGGCTCGH